MKDLTVFWLAHSLRQGRMILAFLLVITMIIINAFSYSAIISSDLAEQERNQQLLRKELDEYSKSISELARNELLIKMPTGELRFFADSQLDHAPSARKVSILQTRLPTRPGNGKLDGLGYIPVDLAFIFSTIVGFLALGMTFDSISGEKEQGTLKLLLSYSIPRWKIFVSKMISNSISLFIPTILGLIIHAAIMNFFGSVAMTYDTVVLYLSFFAIASVVIVFFSTLGIVISLTTHDSVVSLIISLSIWTLFAFVIPGIANYTGKSFNTVPSMADLAREEGEMTGPAIMGMIQYAQDHPDESPERVKAEQERIMEDFISTLQSRVDETVRKAQLQPGIANMIGQFSPIWQFKHAMSTMTGTNISNLIDFYNQTDKYSRHLYDLVKQHDQKDPASDHTLHKAFFGDGTLTAAPIESPLPVFEQQKKSLAERISDGLLQLPIIILMWIVLFLVGLMLISIYDVR